MNALERTEYVVLRLVRRFLFTENLASKVARWLPYYLPNVNEAQPMRIVAEYARHLANADVSLVRKRVLEVGAGRTNVVGYGLLASGAQSATLLEPFIAFDARRDTALRLADSSLSKVSADRVSRATSFAQIESASIDVLLSHSVLEHVGDLTTFFKDCRRVLAADGVMLHQVDYRDHFFKYPYGFLTFDKKIWSRWLNPGDLPRWRLYDHLQQMRDAGFYARVLESAAIPEQFARIRPQLAREFEDAPEGIAVTQAVLFAHAPSDPSRQEIP